MFNPDALDKIKQIKEGMKFTLPMETFGRVVQVVGNVIEVTMSHLPLGALVRIFDQNKNYSIEGEVVGFRKGRSLVIPFADPQGVCANALVQCLEHEQKVCVGEHLIGRILDGYGRPLDGRSLEMNQGESFSIVREPLNPLTRKRITRPFDLGVRSINTLLTCGEGQRVGIMAGSGVGKSVLLGMVARYAEADINVIALIGERGREVREFLEENLGEEGLKKSIIVVATGDQSPLIRIRASHVATSIAEYFRAQGKKVLFMMDSLTRVAMAQREIGLAVGEPPTTKGYTPSVFSLLPRLLERVGNSESTGSITGIYTVLVDGDDFNDPICDAARSILDGHINLDRDLAARNHFPAIDILTSASRVMIDITDSTHQKSATHLRTLLAEYKKNEDLLLIGAYNQGSNARLDEAIKMVPLINEFLVQDRNTSVSLTDSVTMLKQLAGVEQ